jgi:hypothetical protein
MPTFTGIWIALAGGLAALAGLSGRRRIRRLRSGGIAAWAVAVSPLASARQQRRLSHRVLLQYTLADGRVLERPAPATAKRAAPLRPGQKVLIWYDPADPTDILVYGREGRISDTAFLTAGALFILAGAGIAAFAT